ncbi:MAG TPA: L,D-transpeptidase family protein [Solirubrobacteraceae bacterium]
MAIGLLLTAVGTAAPPAQAGSPPAQAGSPPVQAGSPPVQAGNRPARAGNRPARAGSPPAVGPTQELAALLSAHDARSALPPGRSHTTIVAASRPITGVQTVLPVIGRATTTTGAHWLHVMLPGRPNAATGWITQRGTSLRTTRWHLVVRTSTRQLRVYHSGHLIQAFPAIVGKPATPTPEGLFFVEESIQLPPASPGAPFALALSARSNVLQEFDGGPGQIAIHGLANLGGTLGTAVSHGCVRLAAQAMRWLVGRISPGVPVTIES